MAVDGDAARIAHAWRELRRGAAMTALQERMKGEVGLDLGQRDTLEVLVSTDGCRMSELADALRVDASTATRAVARLVDAGLAERTSCATDARAVRVHATDEGRRLNTEMLESRRTGMDELLAGFTKAERRALADGMEKLVAALDAMVAASGSPTSGFRT
jgi:DNA-binding MarR family transcriptional regulator